jgi:hypothetical protein
MANPDRGYKDRLLELRKQLADSVSLGLVNPELFQQQLIQMLNGIESIKQKSQSEIERLSNMIGEERGRVKACIDMGDLVVNIVSAFVSQEKNRLVEEERLKAEKDERDAYAASTEVTVTVTEPSPTSVEVLPEVTVDKPAKATKVTLPPGVNVIKSKKSIPKE